MNDIAHGLQRSFRMLAIATVVLYIALGALALESLSVSNTTTDALCTLRSDLQARAGASTRFLLSHPGGFAGIPPATIRRSIAQEQSTIHALSGLDC